jgi:hypothetical protein
MPIDTAAARLSTAMTEIPAHLGKRTDRGAGTVIARHR